MIDARRSDRLDAAVARLAARTTVVGVVGDVTDPAHRAELARVAASLGTVGLLVNNASTLGASPLPALDAIEPETFLHIFDVNVVAPLALVHDLGELLDERATVVNITSDAAVEPYAGWGGYGASKAALEHASRVLAVERPDLRVLVVDPGDMRTEMHQDAFPGEDISDRPEPETRVPALARADRGRSPERPLRGERLRGGGIEGVMIETHAHLSRHPCRRWASCSTPSTKRTSRPKPPAAGATRCGCS